MCAYEHAEKERTNNCRDQQRNRTHCKSGDELILIYLIYLIFYETRFQWCDDDDDGNNNNNNNNDVMCSQNCKWNSDELNGVFDCSLLISFWPFRHSVCKWQVLQRWSFFGWDWSSSGPQRPFPVGRQSGCSSELPISRRSAIAGNVCRPTDSLFFDRRRFQRQNFRFAYKMSAQNYTK